MRRVLVALLVLLALPLVVRANEKRFGYCQLQATGVRVTGCTVTVYNTGTLTLATIYADNLNTPLANPFTADLVTGQWSFYAPNGRFDVNFQGGAPTISPAYTLSDYLFNDPFAANQSGGTSFAVISSQSINIAQSGFLRMAPGDCLTWRNNANTLDNCLTENASDQLAYQGSPLVTVGANNTLSGTNTLNGPVTFNSTVLLAGTTTLSGTTLLNGPLTISGTAATKNLNGQQFADQFVTTSTVGNPVMLANITGSASGGTVAANTYACEITYNGATSGETLVSPTSGTQVFSGSTNQLACAPGDLQTGTVPAGVLSYNVYWQTGGAGSYWKGHASVALTTTDIQTTTPATSGTNPPVSNTALATLPTAQTALGGNPGTLIIPTTEPANAGWPGTPLLGQTIVDQRNGVSFSNINARLPNQIVSNDTGAFTTNQPNPLLSLNLNTFNFEAEWHAAQFSTNGQFAPYNAVEQIGYKTTAGANVFGMLGLAIFADTFNPGQGSGGSNSVPLYVQNRCQATNCHIWGINPLVQEQSGFRPEFAVSGEFDYNNNSGTDATAGAALIEDGVDIISGGTNKPRQALTVVASTAGAYWQEDAVLANYQTNGLRLQAGATGSAAIYIVPPDNTSANEILGRNATNSGNNWFIQNVGTAQFAIVGAVNWFQDNSGCNVAGSGVLRLCNADHIVWRDSANGSDHVLGEVQHVRGTAGCTTASTLNATCTTTITWPSAFADTNYTVIGCEGKSTFTGTPVLQGEVFASRTASVIIVQTINLSAVASSFATIDCTATHD